MPSSAIHAGFAAQVLAIDKMPPALRAGTRPPSIGQPATHAPAVGRSGMAAFMALLRSGTGHDFTQYKKSTITRRIERRMAQHGLGEIDLYLRYLKEHPAEVQTLFRELLINVTSFFRDAEAFATLRNTVLPAMLAALPEGHVLRVWVAGCATGEEAYSIAILLHEAMEETPHEHKLQIYATDIDEEAIATARASLYPPNIAQDVSPEQLRRFFSVEGNGYRVRKEIREMVVFAVQSVVRDPPFTRLDLLACRNLLIYLEPELQNRLIQTFHYALKPGGVLLLSPSESIGNHTELFEPIDRKWKLYRARPSVASTRAMLDGRGHSWAAEGGAPMPPLEGRATRVPLIAEIARRALLQAFAPAAVVTDPQGNIVYVHGETGRYLRPAPGQPTHNVVEMAREGLKLALREALRLAADKGQATLNQALSVRTNGDLHPVSLSVRPLREPDAAQWVVLVSFEDLPAAPAVRSSRTAARKGSGEAQRIEELDRELAHAKESMSAMLEEQQASNEELKSTNEELQSTNEELQSTNEELETSKEELQSVNEELVTVNSELQTRIEQMTSMQDDMKNLLDNLRLGTIFLDRQLVIRRFTRDATKVYRLVASDVGRPLADIRSELPGVDLLPDAQSVLDTLVPVEREVSTGAGRWYLARIQPYRTVDDAIDGVVLTFGDVTERVQAIAARKARDLAEAVVDAVSHPLVVLDAGLTTISANSAFHREFGGARGSAAGRSFFAIGERQWDITEVRELLQGVLPHKGGVERRTLEHEFAGIGRRRLTLSAQRIDGFSGAADLVLLAIEVALRAGDEARSR
jgi:two-component system CheB/CheR fusion protein